MRQSRRTRKKQNNRDKLYNFIVFFILGPLVAVFVGLALVNHLILPQFIKSNEGTELVSNKDNEANSSGEETDEIDADEINDNDTANEETLEFDIQDFYLYSIQVGNFSNLENAKTYLEEINAKGIGGYILKIDTYKVFAGAFFNRQDADNYIEYVRQFCEDAFIDEKFIEGNKIQYVVNDQEYLDDFNSLLEKLNLSYSMEANLWIDTISNSKLDTLKNNILKHNEEIEQLLSGIKVDFKSEELSSYMELIKEHLSKRKELGLRLNDSDLIENYTEFNKILIDYVNMIKIKASEEK